VEVVDRHGRLLRSVPDADGTRFLPVALDRTSPYLVDAVVAAEDARFRRHPGIDPLALARAAWQNARAGEVVSGGSTLTMQLARILDPRPRGVAAKARQAALALRLEVALSKDAILEAYLSRAPMGNRLVGYEAASRAYLGKPAAQLSPAEAALLAAIPRAPSAQNPWHDPGGLRLRRDRILERMRGLDPAAREAAKGEAVVLAEDPFRGEAPEAVARALEEAPPGAARIETGVDVELQRRVERIAAEQLRRLEDHGVTAVAVAVLDVRRGTWLALEGSGAAGPGIDGTRAPRQPGSALKPFTYAVAFDRGFTPATVIADLPTSFVAPDGTWTPRNYDDAFHGPLRAREALACSVNVPAAVVLDAVGPAALLAALRDAGITTLVQGPEWYGLGLTLGAGEVRLDELTAAYASLLRGGVWRRPSVLKGAVGETRRVVSEEAAAQVVDVLADPEARAPAFGAWSVLRLPFPAAVKTGTSEGFHDNWAVGGNSEVVVGVWAGSFDRAPMGNVSGVTGAGTVWREVMLAWREIVARGDDPTLAAPPSTLEEVRVCALSGMRPGAACPRTVAELFREGTAPGERCSWHRRGEDGRIAVSWPPRYVDWAAKEGRLEVAAMPVERASGPPEVTAPVEGDAFLLAADLPRRFQSVELRASVPGSPREVVWIVNGREVARAAAPYSVRWTLAPGTHRVEARADGRRSRPVTFTVYGG
jgi:penicillin-binding protein 1C